MVIIIIIIILIYQLKVYLKLSQIHLQLPPLASILSGKVFALNLTQSPRFDTLPLKLTALNDCLLNCTRKRESWAKFRTKYFARYMWHAHHIFSIRLSNKSLDFNKIVIIDILIEYFPLFYSQIRENVIWKEKRKEWERFLCFGRRGGGNPGAFPLS